MTFALPPITCARDAADIGVAVIAAVSTGDLTLGEAAEVGKLIDSYVKAYKFAEVNEPTDVRQLTDEAAATFTLFIAGCLRFLSLIQSFDRLGDTGDPPTRHSVRTSAIGSQYAGGHFVS